MFAKLQKKSTPTTSTEYYKNILRKCIMKTPIKQGVDKLNIIHTRNVISAIKKKAINLYTVTKKIITLSPRI